MIKKNCDIQLLLPQVSSAKRQMKKPNPKYKQIQNPL